MRGGEIGVVEIEMVGDGEIGDVRWIDEGLGDWRCGHDRMGRLEMGDKVLGRLGMGRLEMWSSEDERLWGGEIGDVGMRASRRLEMRELEIGDVEMRVDVKLMIMMGGNIDI